MRGVRGLGRGPARAGGAARLERAAGALVVASVAPFEAEGLDFLAGMGQDNLDEFGAAVTGAAALRRYLDAQRPALLDLAPEALAAGMASLLPEVDRAVLTEEIAQDTAWSLHEAVRVGVDGWLDDDLAFVQPWGFGLDEVRIPTDVWQGSADLMVPFAHGQWLAAQLPSASVHLVQGEGHLSLACTDEVVDGMLDTLLVAAS